VYLPVSVFVYRDRGTLIFLESVMASTTDSRYYVWFYDFVGRRSLI